MKFFILLALLFSSMAVHAKTLIVSDIDDTIKASHVRNKMDSAANALVTTIAFKGMSDTFDVVLNSGDAEIIYVTNALEIMMKSSHTKFIENNKFPKGKIYLRTGSADHHKLNSIRKHIDDDPSIDRLILVGDNGERDITFYNQIRQEYKDRLLVINTYIRIVYSVPYKVLPLEEGQKGFVSPLELLTDLTENDFVSGDNYYEIAEKIASDVVLANKVDTKDPQYFPEWLTCKNFDPGSYPDLMTPEIEKGFEKVRSICE